MVRISESMNFMSSTTSKSGSKWSCGVKVVRSVTEGGEQEEEVTSNPLDATPPTLLTPGVTPGAAEVAGVGDRVTSSRSVGKAPSHQDGLTSLDVEA